jgi:hypothetical protein
VATGKLTKELKLSIITKVMKDFKAAEKAAIEERRIAFGTELYEHTYSAVEKTVEALPEVWREMGESVVIECEGFGHKYPQKNHLTGETVMSGDPEDLLDTVPLGRQRPFPNARYHTNSIDIGDKHPLWKKARKLVQDHIKIIRAENELREKINALLATCRTVKQLEAAWPEAIQFLPKNVVMTTALVPVGLSDQINKALGIPPIESVATSAVRKAAATSK